MWSLLPIALLLIVYGVFYIRFAFVEPPDAVRRLFKIPSIFIFFPEPNQVRAGRIFTGALLIVAPFVVVFNVIFWKP